MAGDATDRVVENFIQTFIRVPPIVHRKIVTGRGISGIHLASYKVLGVLSRYGSLPISEIGKRLYISKPYMTRLVDYLIAGGFVGRIPDPEDRRVVRIVITEAGAEHLRAMGDLFREDVRAAIAGMGEDEIRELDNSLEQVRRVIERIAGVREG